MRTRELRGDLETLGSSPSAPATKAPELHDATTDLTRLVNLSRTRDIGAESISLRLLVEQRLRGEIDSIEEFGYLPTEFVDHLSSVMREHERHEVLLVDAAPHR